jgi:hypothetical protein
MRVDIRPDTSYPVVVLVLAGRPAALCGRIKIGDRLIAVGHTSTLGRSLAEVREMILGPSGSFVLLRFEGTTGAYECNLTRGSGDVNNIGHPDSNATVRRLNDQSKPCIIIDGALILAKHLRCRLAVLCICAHRPDISVNT